MGRVPHVCGRWMCVDPARMARLHWARETLRQTDKAECHLILFASDWLRAFCMKEHPSIDFRSLDEPLPEAAEC